MITLSQHESNILFWSKGWYGPKMAENYWQELKVFCDEYYGMDCDIEGMYFSVRTIWRKILDALPNKEWRLNDYENDTLPHKARYYRGSPNYGNTDWRCKDSFNAEQMIQSRVAVMIGQLSSTETKYYKAMLPKDVGDLKVVNREKLEQMFAKKLDSAD